MKPPALFSIQCHPRDRSAAAAVEFALVGFALMAFVIMVVNLGMLGYNIAELSRSVQQTGRWAATEAAASYAASGGTITETCLDDNIAEFNRLSAPALPALAATNSNAANGSQTTGKMTLQASWSGTAGSAPGIYLLLVGTYHWQPISFSAFGNNGITIRIASAATVVGSTSSDTNLGTACGTSY